MKRAWATIVCALTTILLVFTTAAAPVSAAKPLSNGDRTLLARLGDGISVSRHAETGRVRFLGGTQARPVATAGQLGHPASPKAAARSFMQRYGALLGIANPARELRVGRVKPLGGGATLIRYQQLHRGVRVLGGDLMVHISRSHDVVAVNGEASPGLDLSVQPKVNAARAKRIAIAGVARALGVKAAALHATRPALWVYDPRLMGGQALPFSQLVWRMSVRNSRGTIDQFVAVEAQLGVVALRFDQIAHLDATQSICDQEGEREPDLDRYPCLPADAVALPGSSVIPDVKPAFDATEATFDFYYNRFGRNSIDGAGMTIASTVRYCPPVVGGSCPYINAFWGSATQQMVYGTGFASADDVVGHELTHGVTEKESGLYYYYQSGAINEALSDIFGELIDQTYDFSFDNDSLSAKWKMGEDTPVGAIRDMKNPPAFGQPDRMTSPFYVADEDGSDSGGVHTNSGVANKAAFLMVDGGTFNGQTVAALGIDKTIAIWYTAATEYLGTASEYVDLADALDQACGDLVGITPKKKDGGASGSGAITGPNCTQVGKAITATQMRSAPPNAPNPKTNPCTNASGTAAPFSNTVQNDGAWTLAGYWYFTELITGYDYYVSGPGSMFGWNVAVASDNSSRTTNSLMVPSGKPAFFFFRHAYAFDDGSNDSPIPTSNRYDGGVIEYATAPGGPWTDLGSRIIFNGYSGVIGSGTNPLVGRAAFTAQSHGWTTTKVNLSHLAGQSIYLRFRTGTDAIVGDYGWFVDNVRVYKCNGNGDGVKPTIHAPTYDLPRGTVDQSHTYPMLVKASWNVSDPSGIASVQLNYHTGNGPFGAIGLPSVAARSALFLMTPSTTSQGFRVGAQDEQGNQTSPGARAASNAVFRVFQETGGSPSVQYTGAWSNDANADYFGGHVRHASASGRRASLTMQKATDLAWVSTRGPNRGKADVYVDGVKKARVDLYSASTERRQVVFSISFAHTGTHKIEIRVLGTNNASSSGNRVDIDAFEGIRRP